MSSMIDQLIRIDNSGPVPKIIFTVPVEGVSFQDGLVVLTDGATITPDGSQGANFLIVAATNAARVIEPPANLSPGDIFSITLENTFSGALSATSFNAAYLGTLTKPATLNQRTYSFNWDGALAHLRTSAADVPNS